MSLETLNSLLLTSDPRNNPRSDPVDCAQLFKLFLAHVLILWIFNFHYSKEVNKYLNVHFLKYMLLRKVTQKSFLRLCTKQRTPPNHPYGFRIPKSENYFHEKMICLEWSNMPYGQRTVKYVYFIQYQSPSHFGTNKFQVKNEVEFQS